MLSEAKQQELRDMVTIKDKWYHKIPYLGKKIHTKQLYKKFSSNKLKMNNIILEEVNKELEKNYSSDFFNQFVEASSVMLGDVKQMTVRNTNLDKYEEICKTIKV
jgi:hypothetical protein